MKLKLLFVVLLLLGMQSCFINKDDTDESCSSNCTTLKGHVATADNNGLSDVEVRFRYEHIQELSSYKREIGKTRTNAEGYYEMEVFIKDSEIGESGGHFELIVNTDDIENQLDEVFIRQSDLGTELFPTRNRYSINNILTRNEIFEIDYMIPFKASNLEVSLQNFTPTQDNDYFLYNLKVPYGFPDNFIKPIQVERFAQNLNNTFRVQGILGKNQLEILRIKDGETLQPIREEVIIENLDTLYERVYEY